MKVLTSLTGIEWATFLLRLAPEIWGREQVELYGFAHSSRWVKEGRALGLPRDRILYISEDRRGRLKAPVDVDRLRRMEERYGLPTLWPFVVAEKLLWGADYDTIGRTLQVELDLITEFLARARPDVLLLEAIAGMSTYVMWSWAQRHGVPVVFPFTARLPGRFVVLDNPYDRWTTAERHFAEFRRRGLGPEERAQAEEVLRDIVERRVQPSYVTEAISQYDPPSPVRDLGRGLRYVRNYLRYRGWRDYATRSPASLASGQVMKGLRVLANRARSFFDAPRPGEPYVLYPLQILPEASLMVWAPFFTDQVALIEGIARSLPFGHRLYVKEHVAAWYARPLAFYRALRRIPNVRIIGPQASPHALVRGAAAVVTVTSTMGWEALCHGKPVVTFGSVFYNACPLVRHVTSMEQLPGVLGELLRSYRADEETILQFAAAVRAGSYPGEIDAYMPGFLDPGNIATVAAGIRRELDIRRSADAAPRVVEPKR